MWWGFFQGSKSDKELVQTLEAELIKTLEELQDSGCPPQDLNQDPVALSSELAKKDRELTAKVIQNYTRKDSGCRQRVLTVFISEWE